jgi:hypothetical protein
MVHGLVGNGYWLHDLTTTVLLELRRNCHWALHQPSGNFRVKVFNGYRVDSVTLVGSGVSFAVKYMSEVATTTVAHCLNPTHIFPHVHVAFIGVLVMKTFVKRTPPTIFELADR